MRVSVVGAGNFTVLPIDQDRRDCVPTESGHSCFVSGRSLVSVFLMYTVDVDIRYPAGDLRVNQNPSLTLLHILWVRLHNKYADQLATLNPSWGDERLYQETRRIIGAIIQHITYNEYLPSVLGPNIMEEYGLLPLTSGYASTYDPKVKVQITNEFATAAFRYGHSLVRNADG